MSLVQEFSLTIPAELQRIEEACEFVSEVARAVGMQDEAVYRCYLSIEEICTNVIEHGYHYQGRQAVIELLCQHYPTHLAITVIDNAAPFNPLERSDPDPTQTLKDRNVGGWGIFFVKKYMDGVYYRFEHERNHLTIEKYF